MYLYLDVFQKLSNPETNKTELRKVGSVWINSKDQLTLYLKNEKYYLKEAQIL